MVPGFAGRVVMEVLVSSFPVVVMAALNLELIESTRDWSWVKISSTVKGLTMSLLNLEHGPCL